MEVEKMYSVAIRKRDNPTDYFWMHSEFSFLEFKIKSSNRYWIADPFIYEKDGKTYIFYEAYDLVDRKGKIGYSIFTSNNQCADVKIIINESHHLSFPYIFEYNGEIYMVPETSEDWTVKLYKAIDFPDTWEQNRILLNNIFACDSIITECDGDRYLLVSEMYHSENSMPVDNYQSCWVKNIRYKLSSNFTVIDEGCLVAEGDYGIRNAGAFFHYEHKLLRPGQNSTKRQYGKGLVFFEVESINDYKEHIVYSIDCNEFSSHIIRAGSCKIIGVHTYNFSEHYEVIDFSRMIPVNFSTKMLRIKEVLSRKFMEKYLRLRSMIYNIKVGSTNSAIKQLNNNDG